MKETYEVIKLISLIPWYLELLALSAQELSLRCISTIFSARGVQATHRNKIKERS